MKKQSQFLLSLNKSPPFPPFSKSHMSRTLVPMGHIALEARTHAARLFFWKRPRTPPTVLSASRVAPFRAIDPNVIVRR